jgi:hypothetical protein
MNSRIALFLRENILGRQLETDAVVYKLEDGKLEGVYSDSMTFSDLLLSGNGLRFNMTTVTHEKVYRLDSSGIRGEVKKDFTGTSVFQYAMAVRKSTSQVTGFMRGLSSTVPEHTMEAIVYGVHGVELKDGELRWREQQLFYRDMPTEKDVYRPVAFDAEIRFFCENGKARFEYVPFYYDVDPVTMSRTLSKDRYPTFVSRER